MSRVCTICSHTERAAIDKALVAGEAARSVASRYVTVEGRPLGRMAVQRHKDEHLPAILAKAAAAKEVHRADDLLGEVQKLKTKAISLLLKAEAAGDYRTALAGIREARACLELLLETEGEVRRNPQVNILIASPAWLQTRDAILRALAGHPAARDAVVRELLALEGQ